MEDMALQGLKFLHITGWPSSHKPFQLELKPYRVLRNSIRIEDDLLMIGSKIMISRSAKEHMLQLLAKRFKDPKY